MSSLEDRFSVGAYTKVRKLVADKSADMAHGSGESLCKDSMQHMV